MLEPAVEPMDRIEFTPGDLWASHPPQISHPNKQALLDLACPPGTVQLGRVGYTRWPAQSVPPHGLGRLDELVRVAQGFFDYLPVLHDPDAVEWHVNFADPELFMGYGSGLFAQDEIQVAEHPALAAVREAVLALGGRPRTVGNNGPTPVLVAGVERRLEIDTGPNAAAGRPGGLYGTAFGWAAPSTVLAAARRLEPPTISNILAITALRGGPGAYRLDELRRTLHTAYSGFRVATVESARLLGPGRVPRVVVHTGHWGCGAFGGNRVLMAALQVAAAGLAGVERLVYYVGGRGGEAPVGEALALVGSLDWDAEQGTEAALAAIAARCYRWGLSDGN